MSKQIVGILLAAGRGSRFGSDKMLHPLPDGTPMALVCAASLQLACDSCLCVLRPEQQVLAHLLRAQGYTVIFDQRATQGMGASLALAVHASLQMTEVPAACLVALADMPYIQAATIQSLVSALRDGASLAAPYIDGVRGHPVGFSQRWFKPLTSLQGDQGARELLRSHQDEIIRINTDDQGALHDVDTPAALLNY